MMEKHYEKPDANVIHYRNRVKTTDEYFTDSSGAECVRLRCTECNSIIVSFRTDTENFDFVSEAIDKHIASCPGLYHAIYGDD